MKILQKIVTVVALLCGLTAGAQAQVLIGGFQGATDPTDAGWVDNQNSDPITSDPFSTFVNAGVTGYTESLVCSGPGGFGHPTLVLGLSPAEVAAFNTNSWLNFTFSVPAGAGYDQIYNLALNAPGYGYNNQSWANALEMGNTNNSTPGGMPNFYLDGSVQTMEVSLNYSSVTNAIIAGGESYVQIEFQCNTGGGATNIILNNVTLSQNAFGITSNAPAEPVGTFIVDDFAANGVGPANPTNDDYFPNAENYASGQITNVWASWFGITETNSWAMGVDPSYAPTAGSMEVQWTWGAGGVTGFNNQMVMWENGGTYGMQPYNVGEPYYTNFSCDIMFPSGSPVGPDNTFGQVQFGTYAAGNGNTGGNQDYFGGANFYITVSNSQAGVWQHISIPLNATDPAEAAGAIANVALHMTAGYNGGADGNLTGLATCYVDNIKFTGPGTVVVIPPPVLSVYKAVPGLRMFVGSSATYLREGVITTQGTGESESWVGAGVNYPVNYSFQLLSYPTNIGVTELAILPEASFNTTANFQKTIYNNSFLDYQDSNGLYLTIAPYSGSQVTATVQWKVGLASTAPTNTPLTITNSTAIGTWTLTMNSATSGTLTAPGSSAAAFTITDATVSADFANPAVAVVAEDPNAAAGYGSFEDYGTISITGVASGNQTENFSAESSDFSGGTSPGGYFQNNYSVDTNNLVITRNGLDAYWFRWTQDLQNNYDLASGTNLFEPLSQWISPTYYSGYNIPDETAPRGVGVPHAPNYWELLPKDELPTVDGNFQSSPPTINDPLASKAYFLLTTNTANIFPPTP